MIFFGLESLDLAHLSAKASMDSWAPQWVDFGRDDHRHRIWVRMQRPTPDDGATQIEIYADRKLVKTKRLEADLFLDDMRPTVATLDGKWFLFWDAHPGAGDTWFTNYLVIRRDLRFLKLGQFEHGDSSSFAKTRRFYEYNLLKYQGDRRFWRLGVEGFRIVDWCWNERRQAFWKVGHRYRPYLPRRLSEKWNDPPESRIRGDLVGRLDYFRPLHPALYGLPKNSHFWIMPARGYGDWTIALVSGTLMEDELNLLHGVKTLAGINYPLGSLDPRHPPRLTRSSSGLTLVLTTCASRRVRVSKFRVSKNPFKILLLDSWTEPEWTPFSQ